jgi:nitrite reductase/ring-hydroxylating ferredoxin subunit
VTIHWSGCPAGCGNHAVADIGLLGKKVKVDGRIMDGVDIFIGGRSGPHARQATKVMEDIPCDRLENVLEGLARHVVREKNVEVLKGEKISAVLNPSAEPMQPASRWINVAELKEFKDNPAKVVQAAGHAIAVFKADGQFYAVEAVCPHAGGPLGEGKLNGMEVVCPWHGYSFHLKTGACSTDKSFRARTYPIRVEGESLLVQIDG